MNWIRSGEEEEKRRRRRRASTLGFGTKPEGGREKKGFPPPTFPVLCRLDSFQEGGGGRAGGRKWGRNAFLTQSGLGGPFS